MHERALQDVVRVLPEPMLGVSFDGVIRQANPAVLRVLERPASEVVGLRLSDLVEDGDDRVAAFLARCSRSGQFMPGVLTLRGPGRRSLSCRVFGAALRRREGDDGTTAGILLIRLEPRKTAANRFLLINQKIGQLAKEVHRRLAIESELRGLNAELEQRVEARTTELLQANKALRESNRELENFAHVASHDLQEPLRKIRTFLGLIRQDMPQMNQEIQGYFERVDQAAERMSQLIRDILSLSRITTRAALFQRTPLKKIVDGVLSDLELQLIETGASVTVEDLPTIHADPNQMRQLFQNLLSNALKYRRQGVPPVVWIGTSDGAGRPVESTLLMGNGDGQSTGMHRIVVSDNGIGFEPHQAERIFMPFRRLHGDAEVPGTGIGLTICRRVVERHGGTLHAVGNPGEGSSFVIELPAGSPAEEDVPEQSVAGA